MKRFIYAVLWMLATLFGMALGVGLVRVSERLLSPTWQLVTLGLCFVALFFLFWHRLGKQSEPDNNDIIIAELQKCIEGYLHSAYDTKAEYKVDMLNGHWCVSRESKQGTSVIRTIIKVFTDEDEEFNYNEAVELRDKLME